MPIQQSQVLTVDQICTELGYNSKEKPKRQYDLRISTKEWRESYTSSDGIPGREITEWNSDKGNADIKVMSQRFLACYGERHWPPGNGGLEFKKDEEKLLELLHQLCWKQNLAAKNNQIYKANQEKALEHSPTPADFSDDSSEKSGIGFTTTNSQSRNQSPNNADVDSCNRRFRDHRSDLSAKRRRPSTGKGAYRELSTGSEETNNQSRPRLIVQRKFLLKLTQFQNSRAAIDNPWFVPDTNKDQNSAAHIVAKGSTSQEWKSTLRYTQATTFAPHCAEEKSDSDSEPIPPRKGLSRQRNISGLARYYREDEDSDRMRRGDSSGTWAGAVTAAVAAKDDVSSWTPQSKIGGNIFASESPIDSTVNGSGGGENGEHATVDGVVTRGRSSARKRTLTQGSPEITMSAKRPRPRSTVHEIIWPSTPALSADFELNVDGKTGSMPQISSLRSTSEKSGTFDDAYPSPIHTQAESSAHGAGSDSGTWTQAKRADTYRSNVASSRQDSISVPPICRRCRQLKNKCDGEKPCSRCTDWFRECIYDDRPNVRPQYISPHDTQPPEPSEIHKVHYFFSDTSEGPVLLSRLLGRNVEPSSIRPASVTGYSQKAPGSYRALVDGPPGAVVEGIVYEVECEEDETLLSMDMPDNCKTAPCYIRLEFGGEDLLPQTILGKIFKHAEFHSTLSRKKAGTDMDDEPATPPADQQPRRTHSRAVKACQGCQQTRVKGNVNKSCRTCGANNYDCTVPEPAGLKPPATPSQPSPLIQEAFQHSPEDGPETGNPNKPKGTPFQPAGKELNPVPVDQNISMGDQKDEYNVSNNLSRGTSSQDAHYPVPQSVHSTNTTQATQHSAPNPTPKPKYYILDSDSTSSIEKPWFGPSLSEMTIDNLFTQASAHTSGQEVLKVKFTLKSSQRRFVGRQNIVDRDDAESLKEVKDRFRIGRKEGLRNGITNFNILLEPDFGAQMVVYESPDSDDI